MYIYTQLSPTTWCERPTQHGVLGELRPWAGCACIMYAARWAARPARMYAARWAARPARKGKISQFTSYALITHIFLVPWHLHRWAGLQAPSLCLLSCLYPFHSSPKLEQACCSCLQTAFNFRVFWRLFNFRVFWRLPRKWKGFPISLGGANFEIIPTNNSLPAHHLWARSWHFPSRAGCIFNGRQVRPKKSEATRPIPWYQPRTGYAPLRSRYRSLWAWWWRIIAIIGLHCLSEIGTLSLNRYWFCRRQLAQLLYLVVTLFCTRSCT